MQARLDLGGNLVVERVDPVVEPVPGAMPAPSDGAADRPGPAADPDGPLSDSEFAGLMANVQGGAYDLMVEAKRKDEAVLALRVPNA